MLGFDATKTKVQLKLALNRLNLSQKKKAAINQNMRRDIAMLLKDGKIESARVRVEHIIREDFLIEALELLEIYADTLLARFGLVTAMKDMDIGISEPIHALVYAAPRVDIAELVVVRDQLIKKYGKDLVERTNCHALECVNPRIIHKLSICTPDPKLVSQYLLAIAQAFDVDYEGDTFKAIKPILGQSDFVIPSAPPHALNHNESFIPTAPLRPSENTLMSSTEEESKGPDFGSLAKRFESLRKK